MAADASHTSSGAGLFVPPAVASVLAAAAVSNPKPIRVPATNGSASAMKIEPSTHTPPPHRAPSTFLGLGAYAQAHSAAAAAAAAAATGSAAASAIANPSARLSFSGSAAALSRGFRIQIDGTPAATVSPPGTARGGGGGAPAVAAAAPLLSANANLGARFMPPPPLLTGGGGMSADDLRVRTGRAHSTGSGTSALSPHTNTIRILAAAAAGSGSNSGYHTPNGHQLSPSSSASVSAASSRVSSPTAATASAAAAMAGGGSPYLFAPLLSPVPLGVRSASGSFTSASATAAAAAISGGAVTSPSASTPTSPRSPNGGTGSGSNSARKRKFAPQLTVHPSPATASATLVSLDSKTRVCANRVCQRNVSPLWSRRMYQSAGVSAGAAAAPAAASSVATASGETVGMTWLCQLCVPYFDGEKYCPHCQQLYRTGLGENDRFDGKSWIGCDKCTRWVHVECDVSAGYGAAATAYADTSGVIPYHCPPCRGVPKKLVFPTPPPGPLPLPPLQPLQPLVTPLFALPPPPPPPPLMFSATHAAASASAVAAAAAVRDTTSAASLFDAVRIRGGSGSGLMPQRAAANGGPHATTDGVATSIRTVRTSRSASVTEFSSAAAAAAIAFGSASGGSTPLHPFSLSPSPSPAPFPFGASGYLTVPPLSTSLRSAHGSGHPQPHPHPPLAVPSKAVHSPPAARSGASSPSSVPVGSLTLDSPKQIVAGGADVTQTLDFSSLMLLAAQEHEKIDAGAATSIKIEPAVVSMNASPSRAPQPSSRALVVPALPLQRLAGHSSAHDSVYGQTLSAPNRNSRSSSSGSGAAAAATQQFADSGDDFGDDSYFFDPNYLSVNNGGSAVMSNRSLRGVSAASSIASSAAGEDDESTASGSGEADYDESVTPNVANSDADRRRGSTTTKRKKVDIDRTRSRTTEAPVVTQPSGAAATASAAGNKRDRAASSNASTTATAGGGGGGGGNASVVNNKELFYADLKSFLSTIGVSMSRNPTLGGRDLDLHRLYKEVTSRGGCEVVIATEGTWARIFRGLENFSASVTDASYRLKRYYHEFLYAYEQVHHFGIPIEEVKLPTVRASNHGGNGARGRGGKRGSANGGTQRSASASASGSVPASPSNARSPSTSISSIAAAMSGSTKRSSSSQAPATRGGRLSASATAAAAAAAARRSQSQRVPPPPPPPLDSGDSDASDQMDSMSVVSSPASSAMASPTGHGLTSAAAAAAYAAASGLPLPPQQPQQAWMGLPNPSAFPFAHTAPVLPPLPLPPLPPIPAPTPLASNASGKSAPKDIPPPPPGPPPAAAMRQVATAATAAPTAATNGSQAQALSFPTSQFGAYPPPSFTLPANLLPVPVPVPILPLPNMSLAMHLPLPVLSSSEPAARTSSGSDSSSVPPAATSTSAVTAPPGSVPGAPPGISLEQLNSFFHASLLHHQLQQQQLQQQQQQQPQAQSQPQSAPPATEAAAAVSSRAMMNGSGSVGGSGGADLLSFPVAPPKVVSISPTKKKYLEKRILNGNSSEYIATTQVGFDAAGPIISSSIPETGAIGFRSMMTDAPAVATATAVPVPSTPPLSAVRAAAGGAGGAASVPTFNLSNAASPPAAAAATAATNTTPARGAATSIPRHASPAAAANGSAVDAGSAAKRALGDQTNSLEAAPAPSDEDANGTPSRKRKADAPPNTATSAVATPTPAAAVAPAPLVATANTIAPLSGTSVAAAAAAAAGKGGKSTTIAPIFQKRPTVGGKKPPGTGAATAAGGTAPVSLTNAIGQMSAANSAVAASTAAAMNDSAALTPASVTHSASAAATNDTKSPNKTSPARKRARTTTAGSGRGRKKATAAAAASESDADDSGGAAALAAATKQLEDRERALAEREAAIAEREQRLSASAVSSASALLAGAAASSSSSSSASRTIETLQNRLSDLQREYVEHQGKVTTIVSELLRDLCRKRAKARQERLMKQKQEIGRVVPRMEGHMLEEVWEDGELFLNIAKKQAAITKELEEISTAKKNLTKKRSSATRASKKGDKPDDGSPSKDKKSADEKDTPTATSSAAAAAAGGAATAVATGGVGAGFDGAFARPLVPVFDELTEQNEVFNLRQLLLKKQLSDLKEQEATLEAKKEKFIRFQKLMRDEAKSRFALTASPTTTAPVLYNNRYVLLHLLGKGGFSEVFKAFDLTELRYVACKIHQLNTQWSDERKRNYTKHATREYNIHKNLDHPRVVKLFDVFAIDLNSFCTVLEFCDGQDLDVYLKTKATRQQLSDREARCIIMQVFSGLKYLNEQKQRIIHYDLKPGNILFHKGQIKITDFGLSKIIGEESMDGGIELTSQGAGTYWYLPPECFEVSHADGRRPMITSKVDVWSAGIILYQMLFGRKPFGHGLTPENMLSQQTITRATAVDFPAKPAIADSTKEFIRRCLAHNPNDRPDILHIFNENYLKLKK